MTAEASGIDSCCGCCQPYTHEESFFISPEAQLAMRELGGEEFKDEWAQALVAYRHADAVRNGMSSWVNWFWFFFILDVVVAIVCFAVVATSVSVAAPDDLYRCGYYYQTKC